MNQFTGNSAIANAVGNATDGSFIKLTEGTYLENITIRTNNLTIEGTGDASNTIIDGSSTGTVVTIESDSANISGITIRNSGTGNPGIRLSQVSECDIEDNIIIANGGPGIEIAGFGQEDSLLEEPNNINGNTISNNNGSGIRIIDYSRNLVTYNNILDNTAGITNESGTVIDATNNWWGHSSGPYHSTNPDGQGNSVSDNVTFSPWAASVLSPFSLTISSSSGGSVTSPGEGNFSNTTGTVNLTATPDTGYIFSQWTGDIGTVSDPDSATTSITMTADCSIIANFIATTIGVNPNSGDTGDDISYAGQGYRQNDTIDIYFSHQQANVGDLIDSDITVYEHLANISVNASEAIAGSFTVPVVLSHGNYPVSAGTYYLYVRTNPASSPGSSNIIQAIATFTVTATTMNYDHVEYLQDGWNLLSTDKPLDASSCVWGGNIVAVYRYTSNGYLSATFDDLEPVEALFVLTNGGGYAGLIYDTNAQPGTSTKSLSAGWNLISSSSTDKADAILSSLRYVILNERQLICLTTIVCQGDYNTSNGFYLPTLTDTHWTNLASIYLNPFDGYWIYVDYPKNFGVVIN